MDKEKKAKKKRKKNARQRVLMIINPKSGRKRPYFSAGKIADLFDEKDMEIAVFFTSLRYNADYLVGEYGKDVDIIACYGGDGTISEIITGMMRGGVKKPIGYIPAGTTNDLARSLNMQTGLMPAARTIVNGEPRPLDVGTFNDDYFIYIASFGAFTEVSYATPQKVKNIFGHMAYILNAFRYMNTIHNHHVRVKSDTKSVEGDYIFGAVMNSRSVAGVFKLDENDVDFADGQYEVMLIKRPKRKIEVLSILMSMLRKRYKHNENITFFRASELDITTEEELDWAVDGECIHGGHNVHIKNNKCAVNLIMKGNNAIKRTNGTIDEKWK